MQSMKMIEVLVGEGDIVSLSQVGKKICLNQWKHEHTTQAHNYTRLSFPVHSEISSPFFLSVI